LIHQHSSRHNKQFVAINCAAIPENLLESELFGYEKGAFTGAYSSKKGKLEIASEGTLLLDEIGDMPLNLQSKLLRALQENEFYRLGGTEPIKVDLRVLSITNQNISELIKSEKLRKDLYFRLVHRTIVIPPLRERKEDISVLINHFTNRFCQQSNKTVKGYSLKAFQILQNYYWIGNVRQLENEIRSIVNLIEDGEMVTHELISAEIKSGILQAEKNGVILSAVKNRETEKGIILQLLEKNDWNQSRTARELNMTYWGLHKKIKRIGIMIPINKKKT
jgi:transcriptional regulator with PAS, ATPase and Fis domain